MSTITSSSRPLLGVLLLALSSGTAVAQSLNIDIQYEDGLGGALGALPATTFGGNATQFGVWNDWRPATFGQAFVAIDGAPTSATMSMSVSPSPWQAFFSGINGFPGHDDLMGDFFEASWGQSGVGTLTFSIAGLSAGTYDVITYAGLWNCGNPNTVSVDGSIHGAQAVEGFARHRIDVTSGTIVIRVAAATSACTTGYMVDCQGMQLVKLGDATAICAGDGTAAACPCGNNGGAGRGCANSFEPLGAQLVGTGLASDAFDSFVLSASGVSNAAATFFQGSAAANSGAGVAFGDGLRCAGGSVVRIASRTASGNQVAYPGALDLPLGFVAGGQAPGTERIYQVWYRNAASYCTNSTFNLTNGVRVVWAP